MASVIVLCLTAINGSVRSEDPALIRPSEIKERPMRAEFVMKIGSDKENEDFFNPRAFAVDQNGRIFVLDSGNSRIECFSRDGKYQSSFGRRGQGPGELSKNTSNIRILEDGNIYVIDNPQHRISVYSSDGQFMRSGKTAEYYDDIVLTNGTYYLSSILLKENHKPITVSRPLGKIVGSFGLLVEPAIGLIKEIENLPNPEPWTSLYRYSNFTNIIADKNGEIISSQEFPYRLIKYNSEGRVLKDVLPETGFDTYGHVHFTVKKDDVSVSSPKLARVLDMSKQGSDQLVVPFLNPEKNLFFIDIYDLDLNLRARHRMPNTFVDDTTEESLGQVIIDNSGSLYGLILSQEGPARVAKFRLIYD
ncbi:MAG: 6-bladed beta-propeller [Candidatus Aminicenantales bacterium]